jgi:hypothetical protein
MYGPLLMLVIFAPLFVVALFFAIVPDRLHEHYDRKRYYTWKDGERHCFYGQEYEVKRLAEWDPILLADLQKKYKKMEYWRKWWSTQFIFIITAIILGLLIFIFGLISIVAPIEARDEMAVWAEFAEMAEKTFENAKEYEKYGIAGDVAEYNKWLAEARASKKLYGNWSSYYFCDIDSLRPISLGK